jgi:hypothetical protein
LLDCGCAPIPFLILSHYFILSLMILAASPFPFFQVWSIRIIIEKFFPNVISLYLNILYWGPELSVQSMEGIGDNSVWKTLKPQLSQYQLKIMYYMGPPWLQTIPVDLIFCRAQATLIRKDRLLDFGMCPVKTCKNRSTLNTIYCSVWPGSQETSLFCAF